jgi:hypothetical protein
MGVTLASSGIGALVEARQYHVSRLEEGPILITPVLE